MNYFNYRTIQKAALAIVFFLVSAGSAQAFQHKDQGFYSDLLIGAAHHKIDNKKEYYHDETCTEIDGTLNLGYQFAPNFALEAGLSRYTAQILGKYIVPLSPCDDLFFKAGIGLAAYNETKTTTYTGSGYTWSSKTDDTKVSGLGMIAIGATHYINEHWAVTGEANYGTNRLNNNDTRLSILTGKVGMTYHF